MGVDQEILIKIQKIEVEILDVFVRICEENNLVYFLIAGTLLGAVRHKGFIPWDDDIDVAMPRKDFEIFLDLFQKNTETGYYILSDRHPNKTIFYYEPFAKLCKKGTVSLNMAKAINIDIFPFDNCILPFLPLQTKLIKYIWRLYRIKSHHDTYIPKNRRKFILIKLLCCLFPLPFINFIHKKLYLLFNNFDTGYITFFSGSYNYKKETHKYNTVYPLLKIVFEEKLYFVPRNWDIFLKTVYGNYMELPPVEQRIGNQSTLII
jgi:lipopolysaccharide cholinephosphotransferase